MPLADAISVTPYVFNVYGHITLNYEVKILKYGQKNPQIQPEKGNYFFFPSCFVLQKLYGCFNECLYNLDLCFKVVLKRRLEINSDFHIESSVCYKEFYISGLRLYHYLVVGPNLIS